jgi:hypothetical protein
VAPKVNLILDVISREAVDSRLPDELIILNPTPVLKE